MATISEALALAQQQQQAGRLDAAEDIYRRILAVEPQQPGAWHGLGDALRALNRFEEAARCYQTAVAIDPALDEAYHGLAIALRQWGRLPEAEACLREGLQRWPGHLQLLQGLGNVLVDQGRLPEAESCFAAVMRALPAEPFGYLGLANVRAKQGRLDEAIAGYRAVLQRQPRFVEAYNNLGIVLEDAGRADEAIEVYGRALELDPGLAATAANLAICHERQGQVDAADHWARRAVQIDPGLPEAHMARAAALLAQGDAAGSVASCRQALELRPASAQAHSNRLLAAHYEEGVTAAGLRMLHVEWARRHAPPPRGGLPAVRRIAEAAPLRVGFVSPDFGRHPVGYFLVRLMEHLDPARIEAVCYSDRGDADDLAERLRRVARPWRTVRGWSDDDLEACIRSDRIDVLVDLAGHTAGNRLPLFARKPAAVQMTWMGYVGTTGLEAIDYLLADRFHVPLGEDAQYVERVLRLPDGYVCYDPPDYAPDVGPLPAGGDGPITLGSFSNVAKLAPGVVATWSEILRRLPTARLLLKFRGLDQPHVQARLRERFAAAGVAPARVTLEGAAPHVELLASYQRVDVALDTWPYSGGLTTCEALWMGVPVITLPGSTFAGRHALSHLSNVGLRGTIARQRDEYIALAVGWAEDRPRLARTRAELRATMAASPLCDGRRFAQAWTERISAAWRDAARSA